MIKAAFVRASLAAAMVATVTGAAAAQTEPATPEGVEWHLAGYAVEGEIGIVPWHIDATLLLEDGTASGSTGCNRFSGSYTLEGEVLTFNDALAMTRMACTEDRAAVEDGFVANLPQTSSWAIEDGFLSLADAEGAPLLDFEEAVVALTPSDVAALVVLFADQQAQLDQLDQRLDNVRIGTLRDRIKTLETQVRTLRAAQSSSAAGSSTGGFTAAEKVLLRGVFSDIRSTCRPLRGSGLPSGTVAALQCKPGSGPASEMAFYLMEYEDGRSTFRRVMNSHGAPDRLRCHQGRSGQALLHPNSAEGCFVDGGRANVRLMYMATACKQLDAGGTHLVSPVMYMAIEGKDRAIKPLYEWTRASNRASSVSGTIPAPGQPSTPVCESDF